MKVNLAKVIQKNRNCYGFIWQCTNGLYGYQNDNDLGLDIDGIDFKQKVKKIRLRPHDKRFVYQINWEDSDGDYGVPLDTAKALALECHQDDLNEDEQMLCDEYWSFI